MDSILIMSRLNHYSGLMYVSILEITFKDETETDPREEQAVLF